VVVDDQNAVGHVDSLYARARACASSGRRTDDDPSVLRQLKTGQSPYARVGCDVVVVGVDPTVPATPPEGESDQDLRVAVAEGMLTAWRTRQSWQADGPSLDQLASDVEAMISRRGITTAGEL
jgi:hypothetical protein